MSLVIIEICESNPAASLDVEALEQEFQGVSVLRNYCLSECELCAEMPFMMVNGDIVTGEDLPSLLQHVRDRIVEELADWS